MKYGLIGKKLGHSFSKEIHEKIGEYSYELKEISCDELGAFLEEKNFLGINVTIPYKEAVIPYLYDITKRASDIGAVNTIINKNGKLIGDNTDFFGLRDLILKNGIDISKKKVLILGTGGTSKTAKAVAASLGAREVICVSRGEKDGAITYDKARENHCNADVMINTTPLGMYPDNGKSPVDINDFPSLSGVIDVIYNPLSSKLVLDAKKKGIPASGGLYMLVSQAVYAEEAFLDKDIDKKALCDKIYNELYSSKQNIVLTGMPGSGKSTVGHILAQRLKKEFVDTDDVIFKKYGRTPAEIITTDGEDSFRDVETEVIREVSSKSGRVIATGGGTVLRAENIDALSENGKIIFIDRPIDTLIPTADRPLSSTKEDILKRYNERYHIYRKTADYIVLADKTEDEVTTKIEELLK